MLVQKVEKITTKGYPKRYPKRHRFLDQFLTRFGHLFAPLGSPFDTLGGALGTFVAPVWLQKGAFLTSLGPFGGPWPTFGAQMPKIGTKWSKFDAKLMPKGSKRRATWHHFFRFVDLTPYSLILRARRYARSDLNKESQEIKESNGI